MGTRPTDTTATAMTDKTNRTESEQHLWTALKDVEDPEFPVSVVDMGLIRELELDGNSVQLTMTYTTTACPCMDWIEQDIRERLFKEPYVEQIDIDVVWDSPWTADDLSSEARQRLKEIGVTV